MGFTALRGFRYFGLSLGYLVCVCFVGFLLLVCTLWNFRVSVPRIRVLICCVFDFLGFRLGFLGLI